MMHYVWVTNALSLFIDNNSRFKTGSLKRLCQSLLKSMIDPYISVAIHKINILS